MKTVSAIGAILALLLGIVWLRSDLSSAPVSAGAEVATVAAVNEPIQPIPLHIELDAPKVALGNQLFHDVRLSGDNSISCASCHSLSTGGVDREIGSMGIKGQLGSINAPTVFNSGFNFKQFWDGRAEDLEGQVDGPTHAPAEMGSSWVEIIGKLKQSSDYVQAFNVSYPGGIESASIKDAIATFERSLYTPNSRFDQFLRGQAGAITDDEKEGYRLFKTYGCVRCHQGVNVGGNLYQEFGVMTEYLGRQDRTGALAPDRQSDTSDGTPSRRFKVPGLRNVALTAPYFHDGSASNLEQAVTLMAHHQLGRRLSPEEVDRIVKFLKTLTGEYRGKRL